MICKSLDTLFRQLLLSSLFTNYSASPQRILTFNSSHLIIVFHQAARTVLHSAEPVTQMLADWGQIDFEGIARQAMWTFGQETEDEYTMIKESKSWEHIVQNSHNTLSLFPRHY